MKSSPRVKLFLFLILIPLLNSLAQSGNPPFYSLGDRLQSPASPKSVLVFSLGDKPVRYPQILNYCQ